MSSQTLPLTPVPVFRFGYQMVSKPVQNTVVIDLSSNQQLTGSTCVDESESILKCMLESTCSGSVSNNFGSFFTNF